MHGLRVAVAVLVGVLGVAGAAAAPLLAGGSRSRLDDLAVVAVVLTYTAVGLTIELARPRNRVGRILLAGAAAWGLGEGLLAAGVDGLPGGASYAVIGVAGSALRGLGWLLLVVVVPMVFPDGRATWRWAARLAALCVGSFTLASLFSPEPLDERLAGVANPLGVPDTLRLGTDLLAVGSLALAFGCLAVAVISLVRRWRNGTTLVRQQVLVFALAFAPPLLVLPLVASPWVEPWMFALACLPVPVAVGTALLQRRLYDIQLAVNRTVAYAGLSLALAAVYALVVGGIGVVLHDHGSSWLPWVGAGVVAVAFAPLRDSLQGAANRVTYGRWSSPAEVLADTGRRLADAADGPALLNALTEELVHGLGLEHAEIRDASGHRLASSGTPSDRTESVDLMAYGAPVGALHWAGRDLRAPDRALLHDLAHQLGGVVHSAGLVERLRDTQERLVLAREQERRRLRHDLHDGLGPALAGLGFQVDAVQNLLVAGARVDDRLVALRTGLRETVTEVRRIVEGLRPPAIDELGLFGAVAQLGHQLTDGSGLDLALVLPAQRPVLPAAVEVAAYRVAQEALTNVVRHAGASTCEVVATVSEHALTMQISDDGRFRDDASPGVGLLSMRERAGEIGGRVEVRSLARGTAVTVRLPLRTEVAG